jgi:uridine kinase
MLEDVLLISDKHREAGKKILDYIHRHRKEKMIVAISGESGSGKTELAHVIAKSLRKDKIFAKPLHTDNFYNTHPLLRREWRIKNGIQNVVGYSEYQWDAIDKVLQAFKKGEVVQMPCVDLVTEQVDQLTTDFKNIDMLILDGLYAIKASDVDVRVFIDITYLQTKEKHTKDERGKEVMDEVRWEILGREHEQVRSLRKLADLIVTARYDVVEQKKQ